MNYYIQGDAANADKIKAAFEKLGYDTGYLGFTSSQLYYTIGGKVELMCTKSLQNLIKTHPDYKELELPVKFKDGDIIGFNDCTHNDGSYVDWVGIYKEKADAEKSHFFHCVITSKKDFRISILSWRVFTAYPATKEQRDQLFAKMKEAGYEWDAEKKELRKIKPHYDISNFQPFQKVLVRYDDSCTWGVSFLGRYDGMFICCSNICFTQCIPFNDDTKHLLGTTEPCDEQYINW